jgi:hypothetical protein
MPQLLAACSEAELAPTTRQPLQHLQDKRLQHSKKQQ